ncbi:Putative dynein 1 light intermediate chain [Septoria linicola]|uniref:Dynein 1 light intermediate chain n=1 Tax=Septoria linicola TaxID=215465 RepID=A0A9Q9EKJ7_9PEZI|nr:putative dynein 1 light intermediate chain [Septoria linicola]USW52458.1 Putative dynein 1 light intermediate chain [Septoria linicola]
MATTTMSRPTSTLDRQPKRKKEQRTDIWSNLLRQTREAQARNRTQAVQHRAIVVCGGSPEDQRLFVQSLARQPPSAPAARNQERRQQRPKGELRLSNKYAYGYGHVTLYSPPQQSGTGVQVLGAEAEEVARLEVHTLPDATEEYAATLRGLLQRKKRQQQQQLDGEAAGGEVDDNDEGSDVVEQRRPAVCVLLSWKQPWKFLDQLKKWLQLLAQALLQPGVPATDPLDVLKEAQLSITIVVQHTETQEELFREGYKEEDFDYISQCLRTVILPLHPLSALVYTTSTAPPQQPGSVLSEPQKVIFNSARLDLAALSPKRSRSSSGTERREELAVKHEFMDRMAIVIPAGWDSPAFIRTLSETFSPEDIVNGWLADLQPPPPKPQAITQAEDTKTASQQANGGAEVFESSPVLEDADDVSEAPMSPSKMSPSAIKTFEDRVFDPQAHKATRPPQIEVVTKPDQKFLAEMREHLQQLEAQDRDRESKGHHSGVSHTGLSGSMSRIGGVPSGESTGALSELGDVSFNVGGVSYDTITAEAAINALKRPQAGREDGPLSPPNGTRTHTPKPRGPGGNRIDSSAGKETPGSGMKSPDSKAPLDVDKLEEYFQSLLNKSGGSGSKTATPTKRGGAE